MSNKKIIAMIPARIGSKRLKKKNLALINGKPMISYAIEAVKKSKVFDQIIVNSDSSVFENIANEFGCHFYKRPKSLGSSKTKSDNVVMDFIKHFKSDIVAWINPIAPLQPSDEIKQATKFFIQNNLNSLITVKNEQVHCVFNQNPVNFCLEGQFSQTQELTPVQPFVYSIMMWNALTFHDAMEKNGFAILHGKVGYFPVSKLSSIIVKTEEDLKLVEYILQNNKKSKKVEYHKFSNQF